MRTWCDFFSPKLLFCLLMVLFSCSSFAENGAQASLEVVLSKAPSTRESDAGVIVLTIANKSNEPLFLPIQRTPLYGKYGRLWGRILDVRDETGVKAKFIGDFVDLRGPYRNIEDNSWRIDAGQVLTQKIDLAKDYDLSKGGVFKVSYEQNFIVKPYIDESGNISGEYGRVKSNEISLWVSSSLVAPASKTNNSLTSVPGFPGEDAWPELSCMSNPDRMLPISQAMITAGEWITSASNRLGDMYYVRAIEAETMGADGKKEIKYKPVMKDDFQYTLWFGATKNKDDDTLVNQDVYDERPTLADVSEKSDFFPLKEYSALIQRTGSQDLHYHCGCAGDGGVNPQIAAVAKTVTPYLVDICDHFFDLDAEGRAQTFVHEWSHFGDSFAESLYDESNGGANNARQLARESHDRAVKNADSVGYFAQNVGTGIAPMSQSGTTQNVPVQSGD